MNEVPVLVIVTGPSGSGKTTLSRRIAIEAQLPLISRDTFKELLFDTLGWSDREWSRQLGVASYRLLYSMISSLLSAGHSCLVESNFDRHYDTPQFLELQQQYSYRACQIVCQTDPVVVFTRLQQRVVSGERHRGHVDHLELANLNPAQLQGATAPLDLGGVIIDLDTTDFTTIDYPALVRRIQSLGS